MTIPLSLFGPNDLMPERRLDFEMQRCIDAISPSCKYYLRHLCKRHRETFVSGQLGQPSIPCPSTVSHGSSSMDIDETISFEVKSEASLQLQIIEPPSSAGSESKYTDKLQAVELSRIDKHNIDVTEQTKCLARDGNGEPNVVLEFRGMPQTKYWFGQQIGIFNTRTGHDLKEWFDEIDQFHTSGDPPPKARDGMRIRATISDGAPLCSGKLIIIRMQTGEASRFKDMIDMQWGSILVAALSGAAGTSQLLSDSNSDDKVMQWIQNQAKFAEEHELVS
ncbi:uncharacterized protein FTJAE_5069 [Fusarium tjaetaba]|uniref:Uncharacterized protein n=1 Tax=Fusarium tjaetaba TaxID=1567544 RepID=A0A8H5VX86_9HYPO|nr:uncharacterized protein FTJAE_5069 [Fusarium tjaetaba]KAF5638881.1 hypothetical protein FTJAE_5069 [Fusarium tjaetaba]